MEDACKDLTEAMRPVSEDQTALPMKKIIGGDFFPYLWHTAQYGGDPMTELRVFMEFRISDPGDHMTVQFTSSGQREVKKKSSPVATVELANVD